MPIFLQKLYLVFKRNYSARAADGFTLIELVAVLVIMTMIASTMLLSNKTFSEKVLLRDLAYQVAMSIRQAQLYTTSGRVESNDKYIYPIPDPVISTYSYGVHFDSSVLYQANGRYALFADMNNGVAGASGKYLIDKSQCAAACSSDTTSTCVSNCASNFNQDFIVERFALSNGLVISKICVKDSITLKYVCSKSTGVYPGDVAQYDLDGLDISFSHPYEKASIFYTESGKYKSGTDVYIYVTLPTSGRYYVVYVNSIGMISVSPGK